MPHTVQFYCDHTGYRRRWWLGDSKEDIYQVVSIYIKGIFGSVSYSQGKTLALLCVLKFGRKSIGFGGKVQPAIVIIYIRAVP